MLACRLFRLRLGHGLSRPAAVLACRKAHTPDEELLDMTVGGAYGRSLKNENAGDDGFSAVRLPMQVYQLILSGQFLVDVSCSIRVTRSSG